MEIKVSIKSEDEENQLADPSTHFHTSNSAIVHVLHTGGIACLTTVTEPVYILSEQAYKYMLSKCTIDECFDLGILGQSEEHAKPSEMSSPIKKFLNKIRKERK